jgi:Ca2+-binding EF-hand superfamily protein
MEVEKQFKKDELEELRQLFKAFDVDGNGNITVPEMMSMLERIGEKMSQDEVTKMIKEVGKEGSDYIEWKSFLEVSSSFLI